MMEICPVCGNTDVYYEVGGYLGKIYRCKTCGYVGAFIVEGDIEMAEAIKAYRTKKEESSSNESQTEEKDSNQ